MASLCSASSWGFALKPQDLSKQSTLLSSESSKEHGFLANQSTAEHASLNTNFNLKELEYMFGLAVKVSTLHIREPGFEPQLCSFSAAFCCAHWEAMSTWIPVTHVGDPDWVLGSQPRPGCCKHLRSGWMEDSLCLPSLLFSSLSCLSL